MGTLRSIPIGRDVLEPARTIKPFVAKSSEKPPTAVDEPAATIR